jgi:hypothetical protein
VRVEERSRVQVKVMREQWQEPLYSLGAIMIWFVFAFISYIFWWCGWLSWAISFRYLAWRLGELGDVM